MERLAAIGLEIHITEMDVCIEGEVTQEKLDEQADTYRNILEACLGVDAFKSFVMWGFTDRYSYFNNENHPDTGAALIFDESYQAKPAYNALVELLTPEEVEPEPEPEPEPEIVYPWWWWFFRYYR